MLVHCVAFFCFKIDQFVDHRKNRLTSNLKLEARIYNDTMLLLPMNGLSSTAYAAAGVGLMV